MRAIHIAAVAFTVICMATFVLTEELRSAALSYLAMQLPDDHFPFQAAFHSTCFGPLSIEGTIRPYRLYNKTKRGDDFMPL
jgi:hypothetical protein